MKREVKTQQRLVIEHLLNGKKLTSKKAIVYFNIMRLASVVNVLKNQGWDIKTEYRVNLSGGRYAVYYLEEDYIFDYFRANKIFGDEETIRYIADEIISIYDKK
jgi:hypothetical protein